MQVNEGGGATQGIGGERYKSATVAWEADRWPSAVELVSWEKLQRRTPQEALDAAKAVKKQYDESRQ